MEDFVISISECYAYGYCDSGMRVFAKRYKLDFDSFAKNGILASELLATNSHLATQVVEGVKNGR